MLLDCVGSRSLERFAFDQIEDEMSGQKINSFLEIRVLIRVTATGARPVVFS